MEPTRIVILMHNTLAALGVRHLLAECSGSPAHLADGFDELQALPGDAIDYVVTDTQFYVEHLRYFLPRQSHTIVIADEAMRGDNPQMVYSGLSSSALFEAFARLLSQGDTGDSHVQPLSQRETEVLRLVASGLINKEIADALSISVNTVLTHRKNITSKLGIKSVSGLSFYAMMNGIIAHK